MSGDGGDREKFGNAEKEHHCCGYNTLVDPSGRLMWINHEYLEAPIKVVMDPRVNSERKPRPDSFGNCVSCKKHAWKSSRNGIYCDGLCATNASKSPTSLR